VIEKDRQRRDNAQDIEKEGGRLRHDLLLAGERLG
jgi:hypothetical protein